MEDIYLKRIKIGKSVSGICLSENHCKSYEKYLEKFIFKKKKKKNLWRYVYSVRLYIKLILNSSTKMYIVHSMDKYWNI